jgi:hypothetical protein
MFTADNLPEAARVIDADFQLLREHGFYRATNHITARILNRLDAAHNGRLSALLNGTAPVIRATDDKATRWTTAPVATDQPPEVDNRLLSEAHRLIGDMSLQGDALKRGLDGFLQLVWQTHRPAVDPVRFALEKVTDGQWRDFLTCVDRNRYTDGHGAFGWPSIAIGHIRSELAKILPVAQPPRKVEVSPEVMKAFQDAWDASEPSWALGSEAGFGSFYQNHIDGVRAALAVANTQANAREIEAVAEVARLRDLVEQCERKIARKDAVLAHPEIQALLNKIGFGVEPGETEVERLRAENTALANDSRAYETGPLAERDRIERLTKELAGLRTHAETTN